MIVFCFSLTMVIDHEHILKWRQTGYGFYVLPAEVEVEYFLNIIV